MTKVPKKGAWYSCIFICAVSFFLDIEALTLIISLGNLLNYSFVNAGVIALRFRPLSDGEGEIMRHKNERYAWFYLVISFLFAMSMSNGWDSGI